MSQLLLRHRILVASLSFLLSTVAYGTVSRAIDRAPRDEPAFWIRKVNWGPDFDAVVAGDSRVNRGVSPAAMQTTLPGKKIANFAFSGAGLTGEYLAASARLLAPTAIPPVIVLGITPRSLTPVAAENHDYRAWAKTRAIERWGLAQLSDVLFFLTPENPVLLFGRPIAGAPRYQQNPHETGWLPVNRIPRDPDASLDEYVSLFAKTQVSDQVVRELVSAVGGWHERGISVFAFRPPTSRWMIELEDTRSGFQQNAVRDALERVGAKWLEVGGDAYHTVDGNHLTPDSAIEFSADLGAMLREALAGRGSNPQH